MDKFFAALVAILDEALACHELLPSQVKTFEIGDISDVGCWIDLDKKYYTEVLQRRNGELEWSIRGHSEASELA